MRVTSNSDQKEWLQEAVTAGVASDGTFYPVTEILLCQSNKGYILTVEVPDVGNFAAFFWKSGKTGQTILDFLAESFGTRQQKTFPKTYPQLFVQASTSKNLNLGIDDIDCDSVYYAVATNILAPGESARMILTPKNTK